jgi:hypothetical protein
VSPTRMFGTASVIAGGSAGAPSTNKSMNRRPGDAIPLGNGRTLLVIEVRDGPEPDGDPVLVVEPG